jgi:hypothetical protein
MSKTRAYPNANVAAAETLESSISPIGAPPVANAVPQPDVSMEVVSHTGSMEDLGAYIHDQWLTVDTFSWTTSQEPGYKIYSTPIHPTVIHPIISTVASLHSAWSGSLNYRIKIVASGFHYGVLGLARIPPHLDVEKFKTIQNLSTREYILVDAKTEDFVALEMFDQKNIMWHTMQLDPKDYRTFGGHLILFVNNTLGGANTTVTNVSVLLQARLGANFMFNQVIPPSVAPVAATQRDLELAFTMPQAISFTGHPLHYITLMTPKPTLDFELRSSHDRHGTYGYGYDRNWVRTSTATWETAQTPFTIDMGKGEEFNYFPDNFTYYATENEYDVAVRAYIGGPLTKGYGPGFVPCDTHPYPEASESEYSADHKLNILKLAVSPISNEHPDILMLTVAGTQPTISAFSVNAVDNVSIANTTPKGDTYKISSKYTNAYDESLLVFSYLDLAKVPVFINHGWSNAIYAFESSTVALSNSFTTGGASTIADEMSALMQAFDGVGNPAFYFRIHPKGFCTANKVKTLVSYDIKGFTFKFINMIPLNTKLPEANTISNGHERTFDIAPVCEDRIMRTNHKHNAKLADYIDVFVQLESMLAHTSVTVEAALLAIDSCKPIPDMRDSNIRSAKPFYLKHAPSVNKYCAIKYADCHTFDQNRFDVAQSFKVL